MRWRYIVLLVLIGLYLLTGVVQVRRGERAVVRRFGRVLDYQPEPGLWVGLPWGMDRVDRVEVDSVRSVTVGESDEELAERGELAGQLLTGDHNLVNVQVTLYYQVRPREVVEFVLQAERIPGILKRVVEATTAEWVAGQEVDEVLLRGKLLLREALVRQLPGRINAYRLGVEVLDARVARITPPEEVKDAFDSVSRAQTGIATARYRAEQDAATRERLAAADRFRIEQAARAFAHGQTTVARQDARRFLDRLAKYQAARESNPAYLWQIWQEERGRLFGTLKASGQLDLLDHHLGRNGLDVFTAPRLPDRR